jgi:predicted acyltransferase
VNALVLYFLSSLVARLMSIVRIGADGRSVQAELFERLFAPMAAPINASLAFAMVYVIAWWAILWVLYRRNIRVRV